MTIPAMRERSETRGRSPAKRRINSPITAKPAKMNAGWVMSPPPNGRWAPYIPNIMPPSAIEPSHQDSARVCTAAETGWAGGAGEPGVGSVGSVNCAPVLFAAGSGAPSAVLPWIVAAQPQLGGKLARPAERWHQLRRRLHSRPAGLHESGTRAEKAFGIVA